MRCLSNIRAVYFEVVVYALAVQRLRRRLWRDACALSIKHISVHGVISYSGVITLKNEVLLCLSWNHHSFFTHCIEIDLEIAPLTLIIVFTVEVSDLNHTSQPPSSTSLHVTACTNTQHYEMRWRPGAVLARSCNVTISYRVMTLLQIGNVIGDVIFPSAIYGSQLMRWSWWWPKFLPLRHNPEIAEGKHRSGSGFKITSKTAFISHNAFEILSNTCLMNSLKV